MCLPTHLGGLGIRDIEMANLVAISHLSWRVLTNEANLATRILKGKYFHNTKLYVASYKQNFPSSGVDALGNQNHYRTCSI